MTTATARILLVADTHLGFDLPFRPRIQRRRRGDDFFANLDLALQPALRHEVDLVVHGGDLFYRSRVPPALVERALAPLLRVAESGVPVYVVPGNHERSRIPLLLWTVHPNLHIFDRPRTFLCPLPGGALALSGFPFAQDVRDRFTHLVAGTGHGDVAAAAHLLCLHQVVEGARVGPGNYTFRAGPDVVCGSDIPSGFSAVLAGHIHRAQVLRRDLGGRLLAAPVIYPGSVERTAFAEREEEKGYAVVRVELGGERFGGAPVDACGDARIQARFVPLPARPMAVLDLDVAGADPGHLAGRLRSRLAALDPNAVVRVRVCGPAAEQAIGTLTAATLRDVAPPTMNVELQPAAGSPARRPGQGR